jgi:hypothetical protein
MLHVFKVPDERLLIDGSQSDIRTMRGTTYYVNPNTTFSASANPFPGVDTHSGKSWTKAFATMSKALSVLKSGDTIVFTGKVREQLVTPVNIFDVSVIGMGNRPHHADSTPTGGQYAQATWTTPASGATTAPLIKVLQQGWRFENILFAGPTDDACIQLYRDAGAGDLERDASHAVIRKCRFASGFNGINDTGGTFDVLVEDNIFQALTNFCILGVGNIGIGQLMWIVRNNLFYSFTNGVKIAGNGCRIHGNAFTAGGTPNTTVVLNTSNGGGADNFLYNNVFQTATANFNTPDVVGNATDVWTENMCPDTAAAGTSGIFEIGRPA